MAEGLGGSLESFYFAFGATDAYVVAGSPRQPEARRPSSMAVSGNRGSGHRRWSCC